MSKSQNELNKVVTDTEIGNNGVVHSKVQGSAPGAGKPASSAELELALAKQSAAIDALLAENAKLKANQSNGSDINALATALMEVVKAGNQNAAPAEKDNINRTSNFTNKMTVDGRSLMEAQQSLMMFKNETKKPISIAKTFQNHFGPALAITVNGVRVSIPVDGKTYFINATHWEHARERIAKIDRQLANTEPQIVETNA